MILHVTPREGFISLDTISSGLLVPHMFLCLCVQIRVWRGIIIILITLYLNLSLFRTKKSEIALASFCASSQNPSYLIF